MKERKNGIKGQKDRECSGGEVANTTIYTSHWDVCCPGTPSHESPPKGQEKTEKSFSLSLL